MISIYCDRGLDPIGLVMTLLGLLLVGMGCGLHRLALRSASTNLTTPYETHARTLALVIPLGAVLSFTASANRQEEFSRGLSDASHIWPLLILNAVTFVGAAAYSDVGFLDVHRSSELDYFLKSYTISPSSENESFSKSHITSPVTTVGRFYALLLLTFIVWWPSSSIFQVFLLTIALLDLTITDMSSFLALMVGMDHSSTKLSRYLRKAIVLLVIVYSLTLIVPALLMGDHFEKQPKLFSKTFNSRRKVDIVISHYNEPIDELKTLVDRIQNLESISPLQPRFFVYTKGNIDLSEASEAFNEICDEIEWISMPNVGREAGTYLSHILTRWDDLAAHTIFIQAELHSSRGVFNRLNRNFIPLINESSMSKSYSTGVLSLGTDSKGKQARGFYGLGMTSKITTCQDARDRHSWHDIFGIFPYLFDNLPTLADTFCTQNKIPLSYKGQFLVSAKRIRQVPRNVYLDLNKAVTTSEGWGHNIEGPAKGAGGYDDGTSHPIVGYSMERAWYVLFGCIEQDLTRNCPSMLSSLIWSWTGSDDRMACQCLDKKED